MATIKTTDRDLGANDLIKELSKLKKQPGIKLGWPREDSEATAQHVGGSLTVAEIAIIHEFGAPGAGIPERSMLRGSWDENVEAWNKFMAKLADKISQGKMSINQALDLLGLKMVVDTKKRIVAGIPPELKYRDGTPLIDTAQMLNALTFKRIVKGNE